MSSENLENDPITVAASRDGHEYHEAWAARVALGLVFPNSDLHAISMEGFSKEEASEFSKEAMDIADMVQYFGGYPSDHATKVIVTQFKYVVSGQGNGLVASHLSKTISKFVATRNDYIRSRGSDWVDKHLQFEFVTNRFVGENLKSALDQLNAKNPSSSLSFPQKRQLGTLIGANESNIDSIREVIKKLSITGQDSSLRGEQSEIRNTLAYWGGASDTLAKVRFLGLCKLLRDKAGVIGYKNNVVKRTDVLGALDLSDEDELFPVPQSFPKVESVIVRSFMDEVGQEILKSKKPFLIHGSGGSGKTVTMQSFASLFDKDSVCILHDGFGGGRWRMPGDDRHLASRSVVHLINSIAVKGLCDPILPGSDEGTLIRTGLRRLEQATNAIQRQNKSAKIVLLLDAIDHAGLQSSATNTNSFAKLLISALLIRPIEGLVLVASCRTERRVEAIGDLQLPQFEIPQFNKDEIYQRATCFDAEITTEDVHVLNQRSRGNPRCLDALLKKGRPFDATTIPDDDKTSDKILDDLILQQFDEAIELSASRGAPREKTIMLLKGMAIMPPPVPTRELAEAFSLAESEIVSFFSDLAPMIEITDHGLIFRDEPTENVARNTSKDDGFSLDEVVAKLKARQDKSNYATRCLPFILQELNMTDELVELAFSEQFPKSATSSVAIRGIQIARITKAVESCAAYSRTNDVFKLTMEAASIAGGSERADALARSYPELVAAIRSALLFIKTST